MRTIILAAALAAGFAGIAGANMVDNLADLPAGFVPHLEKITSSQKRVYFLKEGGNCPAAGTACARRAFLLPGDVVVALRSEGDYVDAVFTGGPPHFRSTRGWLPKNVLAPEPTPAADAAAWSGDWVSGDDDITVKPSAGGRIQVDGSAVWGENDPARTARGGPNLGYFDTTLVPAAMVTFSPADNGGPAKLNPPANADGCVLTMWLLGPYLTVSDNGQCGGANVTFSNLYRRRSK